MIYDKLVKPVGNVIDKNGKVYDYKVEFENDKFNINLYFPGTNKKEKSLKIDPGALVSYSIYKENETPQEAKDREAKYIKSIEASILQYKNKYVEVKSVPAFILFKDRRTTDGIIRGFNSNGEECLILIKREFPPLGLALPGGIVEENQTAFENFIAEMSEEISFDVSNHNIKEHGEFRKSEIRGTMITNVYEASLPVVFYEIVKDDEKATNKNLEEAQKVAKEKKLEVIGLQAGDDARGLQIVSMKELQELIEKKELVPHHVELLEETILKNDRKINGLTN